MIRNNRIAAVLLVGCFQLVRSNTRLHVLDDVNGGEFSSPNFPYDYAPNLQERYLIRAPRGSLIALTFFNFRTEGLKDGNKTDYFEIFDGRRTDAGNATCYFGVRETPFYYLSSGNRLNLWFRSNNETEDWGFRARYRFLDTNEFCKISDFESDERAVSLCRNRTHGYATDCFVIVGSSIHEYHCVNGTFMRDLLELVISECENNFTTCPYLLADILDYYETNRLSPGNKSAEEIAIEEMELESIDPLRPGRGSGCPRSYCVRNAASGNYVSPNKCGRFKKSGRRRYCLTCRFSNCGVTGQIFQR